MLCNKQDSQQGILYIVGLYDSSVVVIIQLVNCGANSKVLKPR